jgi:2-dehydropantoate 2-reductase
LTFETEYSLRKDTYSEWKRINERSSIPVGRSELLRIAVVGAGAIGCLFGGRLHIAGQSVLLVHHRRSVAAAIEKKGVSIREPSGKIVRSHIKVRTRLSLDDRPELVLVTVKAYDTEEVGSLLVKSVGRNVPVLTLQNGLGNVDALERHLGSGSIMSGATTEAASSAGPGRVIHTGSGTTWLGEINGEISRRCLVIGRVFRAAGFATAVTSNVKGVIWSKAIVNSAINPISSITRLRNGDLLKSPELREIAFKVINEGSGVARANGILLKPSPKGLLARVLALTSNNESSMLQDLEAGRRTEIGQLNGYISRLGNRVGIATPRNDLLTKLVLFLEHRARNS